MTDEGRTADRIEGLPVEDAVDVVVEGGDSDGAADAAVGGEERSADPRVVGAALERIAIDGEVRRAGVEEALAHLSKVVSTPETRVELAAIELDEAREAADDVSDVDVVAERLDRFEERLTAVETQVASVGEKLQAVVDRDDAPLDEVALEIHDVHEAANAAHRAADELTVDIEEFESWLANETVRVRDLEADVDGLVGFLDGVAASADDVEAAETGGDGGSDEGDAALAWADAVLRHRVSALLVDDIATEHEGLEELARRADDGSTERTDSGDEPTLAELAARLGDLEDRRASLEDRLENLARAEWHDRFDDRLAAFDSALDDVGTPVDWGVVQQHLQAHRRELAALQ